MIGNLLGNTDLKQLASFATPAFFDVMPLKALYAQAKELRGNSKDPEVARRAVATRSASLAQTDIPVVLASNGSSAAPRGASEAKTLDRTAHAEAIVELYFHQLFRDEPVLLDLRPESFTEALLEERGRLVWSPASWIASFQPSFIQPLREIYDGFYTADDARFDRGLDALRLLPAKETFKKQFGDDVHAVRFRTKEFTSTFTEVFQQCKRAKIALHPDFVPLGILLASMYQHLEPLDVPVDVATCFARARGGAGGHLERN